MIFGIKKIVDMLLAPGTLILLLLAFSVIRLWRSQGPRRGLAWLLTALVCFYASTTILLPTLLLRPLESQYPPLLQPPEVPYIVVLSAGYRRLQELPVTSQLDESTALRVVEGVRLFQVLDERPMLIMSGGGSEMPIGDLMKNFAVALGVPAAKVLAESSSPDTHGNAREVQQIVHQAPFLLVTAASHLPRSMAIFTSLGMHPIPAPADFRAPHRYRLRDFFPGGINLLNLEIALHEYLGLAYLKIFPGRAGR